jgi:hypothetical protein
MAIAHEQDWISCISVHPEAAEIEGCSFPDYLMLSEILGGIMCLLIVRFFDISLTIGCLTFLTYVAADDEHCIQHPEHEFSISTSRARAYAY